MSSQSPGQNAIILPIIVEIDAAEAKLRDFRRTVTTETQGAAEATKAAMGGVRQTTEAATQSAVTWKQALQGANPAITGVTQALNLMGAQATPAIGGISHAITSLISGGFTPLSLILAGATGVIALMSSFGSKSAEAATQTNTLNEGLNKQVELMKEIRGLELSARAAGTGRSVAAQTTREQLEAAQGGRYSVESRIREQDSALEILKARVALDARNGNSQHSEFGVELTAAQRRMDALMREREEIIRTIRDLEALERARKAEAAAKSGLTGEARVTPWWYDRATMDQGTRIVTPEDMKDPRFLRDNYGSYSGRLAPDEIAPPGPIGDLWQTSTENAPPFGGGASEVTGLKPIPPTYAQTLNRSLQAGVESAFVNGISDALQNPDGWRGALESFAQSMQSVVAQRLAAGIADALLGHGTGFAGGLFASLGGVAGSSKAGGGAVTGGAADPATSVPVTGPAKMSTSSQPIAFINVWDEATADGVASKMSSNGARVVMGRAMGAGVSAGTVPSRRRG